MKQQSDLSEVRKALSGTKELTIFLRKWRPKIFKFAKRHLYDYPSGAEDVTQEVLINVSSSLRSFNGTCKLTTWLWTITQNEARNFIKKECRKGMTNLDARASFKFECEDSVGDKATEKGYTEDLCEYAKRWILLTHEIATRLRLYGRSARNAQVWRLVTAYVEGADVMQDESLKAYVMRHQPGITGNQYESSRQAIRRACSALCGALKRAGNHDKGKCLYEETYNIIARE